MSVGGHVATSQFVCPVDEVWTPCHEVLLDLVHIDDLVEFDGVAGAGVEQRAQRIDVERLHGDAADGSDGDARRLCGVRRR